MADGVSVFLTKELFSWAFGQTAFVPPATIYAAALTTLPSNRGGTGLVEVAGTDYARASLTNNTTNFPAASGTTSVTQVMGNQNITFVPNSVSPNWGTIVGIAFYDAPTGGNLLAVFTLAASQNIVVNDQLDILAGQLTLTA
jgi:hypothetical protein